MATASGLFRRVFTLIVAAPLAAAFVYAFYKGVETAAGTHGDIAIIYGHIGLGFYGLYMTGIVMSHVFLPQFPGFKATLDAVVRYGTLYLIPVLVGLAFASMGTHGVIRWQPPFILFLLSGFITFTTIEGIRHIRRIHPSERQVLLIIE